MTDDQEEVEKLVKELFNFDHHEPFGFGVSLTNNTLLEGDFTDVFAPLEELITAPPSVEDQIITPLMTEIGFVGKATLAAIEAALSHLAYHLRQKIDDRMEWRALGQLIYYCIEGHGLHRPYLTAKALDLQRIQGFSDQDAYLLAASAVSNAPQPEDAVVTTSLLSMAADHWMSNVGDMYWNEVWDAFWDDNPHNEGVED